MVEGDGNLRVRPTGLNDFGFSFFVEKQGDVRVGLK
jgi:hypothetical protein